MTVTVATRIARGSRPAHSAPFLGGPWSRIDALASGVLAVVGVLLLVGGWFGVAEQASVSDQMVPLNVGVVGLVLLGAGHALWFVRGRRAVGKRLRELLTDAAAHDVRPQVVAEEQFLGGSGRFYHRPECAMVTGRAWAPESRSAHEQAGRAACGVCTP